MVLKDLHSHPHPQLKLQARPLLKEKEIKAVMLIGWDLNQ
jgi:hypothetical protein